MYIIYNLMKEIQGNPNKYSQINNLQNLKIFLFGYRACIYDNEIYTTEQRSAIGGDESTKFENFLYIKFNQYFPGTMDFTTILEHYHPNQNEAFNDVFKFHEEYCELAGEEFKLKLEKYQNIFEKRKKELTLQSVLLKYHNVMKEICKIPTMYIGSRKLYDLKIYLKGYFVAMNELSQIEVNPLLEFNEYLRGKYEIKEEKDVFEIIRSISYSDENALDNFFEHLDEFSESL